MAEPLVSVIVPVFNRLEFLCTTIESVLGQSLPDWELIVVDDGSTEDVGTFVAQYVDPRIRFLRQSNRGNAAARNRGARIARGRYLAFLDSDDYWHPDMLEQCSRALEKAPPAYGIAYVRWICVDSQGQPLQDAVPWQPLSGNLLQPLTLGLPIFPSASVLRRACFAECGGFDEALDDWDLWLRLSLRGYQFACVEQPLAYYRLHGANLHTNRPERAAVHFRTLEKLFSSPDLPRHVLDLKGLAYSHQHLGFGLLAFKQKDLQSATLHLIRAFELDPCLIHQAHVYFDVVGAVKKAPQPPNSVYAPLSVDVEVGQKNLLTTLDVLFGQDGLAAELRAAKREAYGRAHYAIGVVHYWFTGDARPARVHLAQSMLLYPRLMRQAEARSYVVRALLGKRHVQWLRALKDRLGSKSSRVGWANRRYGADNHISSGRAAAPLEQASG